MEWQFRVNVAAEIGRVLLIFVGSEEVIATVRYHFPEALDIIDVVTGFLWLLFWWLDKRTRMWRWDLDK